MKIKSTKLSPILREWLGDAADPDAKAPLHVRQLGGDIEVRRPDGSEISATEKRAVKGTMAVHLEHGLRRKRIPREYGAEGFFVEIDPEVWEAFGGDPKAIAGALRAVAAAARAEAERRSKKRRKAA